MDSVVIVKLRERPELMGPAAAWFHEKWHIPLAAYQESMEACLRNEGAVPQWYVAMADGAIVGGLGVIENDFHARKDLAPNVCAVYVEEAYRRRGIAGRLLRCVCRDMAEMGVGTLYLLTDHDSFYERYGWEFYCLAQGDGEERPSRLYVHRTV
ncbi:MAG: GNAT family N-acetyltransferase [Oscillospiraceae bacterium]